MSNKQPRDEKGRFISEEKDLNGFKGLDKNFKCMDKQYEVGKTYKEHGRTICQKGMMHFCELPTSVLKYYPPVDSKGDTQRFATVSSKGKIVKERCVDKKATQCLSIKSELSIPTLCELARRELTYHNNTEFRNAQFHIDGYPTHEIARAIIPGTIASTDAAFSVSCIDSPYETGVERSIAIAGGMCSIATTGKNSYRSWNGNTVCITQDSNSIAFNAFYKSVSLCVSHASLARTEGNNSVAVALAHISRAEATGEGSVALALSNDSKAAVTNKGSVAVAMGFNNKAEALAAGTVALALGERSKVRGVLGSILLFAVRSKSDKASIQNIISKVVDGQVVKENVFYSLNDKGEVYVNDPDYKEQKGN